MSFKKIDRDSLDTITNAVEIFQVPPTNVTISSSKTFEILPSNPLTDTPFTLKFTLVKILLIYPNVTFLLNFESVKKMLMDNM